METSVDLEYLSDSSDSDLDTDLRSLLRPSNCEFLDYPQVDNEDDLMIPLETEDGVSIPVSGEMRCNVCRTTFRSKIRYLIHKRRHLAIQHFVCPKCKEGFKTLLKCQAHELNEHSNEQKNSKSSLEVENMDGREDSNSLDTSTYSFRTRTARKCHNYNPAESLSEAFKNSHEPDIVPSTCLYPYRGPPVQNPYEQYQIELNFGRERKTNSRVQAKYCIETQKRNKRDLALIEKRELEDRNIKQQAEAAIQIQLPPVPVTDVTTPARLPARRRTELLTSDPTIPDPSIKGYFCTLCAKPSATEDGIRRHGLKYHKDLSLREFLLVLRCEATSKELESEDETQSSLTTMGHKKRHNLPQSHQSNFSQSLLPIKHRHIHRPWEKPDSYSITPSKNEFLFAIKLIPKDDVVLGPRNMQNNITSSILRSREREKSPFPGFKKVLRICIEKLKHSVHKKYFVCGFGVGTISCDYFADSKAEIREHRRFVHLKTLRQGSRGNVDYGEQSNMVSSNFPSSSTSKSNTHTTDQTQILVSSTYNLTCVSCRLKVPNPHELRLHHKIHKNPLIIKVPKLSQDIFAKAKIIVRMEDYGEVDDDDDDDEIQEVSIVVNNQPKKRIRVN